MIIVLGEKPIIIGRLNFGFLLRTIKILLHKLKSLRVAGRDSYYPGHKRVSEEVLEGLTEIGVEYNLDPFLYENGSHYILLSHPNWLSVLSSSNGLMSADAQVICGPNVFHSLASECANELKKLNSIVLTPSDWVARNYEMQMPTLKGKIKVWPCGVNEDIWMPIKDSLIKKKVIIYRKHDGFDAGFLKYVTDYLEKKSLMPVVIVYGEYTIDQWKEELSLSCCVIYLTSFTESQGIAQFEAWSMNVPIFVYYVEDCIVDDWLFEGASSSPYLSESSGKFWSSLDDLICLIDNLIEGKDTYSPRKYLLNGYTREIQTKKLLSFLS